jgi:hypothetical protein
MGHLYIKYTSKPLFLQYFFSELPPFRGRPFMLPSAQEEKMKTLETERLVLRQFSKADFDGVIYLVCLEKKPGDPEKKLVPAYEFAVCRGGEKIGNINLRIGYTDGLYYGRQIGYGIDEKYRGNGYRCPRLLSACAGGKGPRHGDTLDNQRSR